MSTQPLAVGGRLKVELAVPLPPVREEPQVMILESAVRPAKAPVVVVPALLTPLLLWTLPGQFLPILLGDYLLLHFALYGLLTLGGLRLLR
jgi:hypothetical protein